MNDCMFVFVNQYYKMLGSPVSYWNSFIVMEICICMTSMMILHITIEVSVNKELPLKGRAQARLGHSWAHLSTFTFRHIWLLGNFALLHFGLNSLKK